jgi:hypothetical protein
VPKLKVPVPEATVAALAEADNSSAAPTEVMCVLFNFIIILI